MRRIMAAALALGATAALAGPAQAASAELSLFSTWLPVTIKVNGKPYVVDGGGPGLDHPTIIPTTVGAKVTLEPPATTAGLKFCYWSDHLNRTRVRTVTIVGRSSDNYTTNYGRQQDC